MYLPSNNLCINHTDVRRSCVGPRRHGVLAPCKPSSSSPSSSSPSSRGTGRFVAARMYRKVNDDLAERIREVWDDEEDIQAAVQRLGLDKQQQQSGDSGPLLSEVNKLYVTKDFPKAHVAQQLELRYIEGKGYGLVASQPIPKGQLLAVCPPLAWVSGPPGQPPRLEQLIRHISDSQFNSLQQAALQSLCSLPALDDELEERQQRRQQQVRRDRLLRAAAEVEASPGPGVPVSSLPLSKSAAIKRMQQQLRAEGRLGEDDADHADETLDKLEDEEAGCASSGSSSSRWGSSSSSSSSHRARHSLARAAGERRRTLDLLELLECTSPAAPGSSAAVAAAGPAAATPHSSQRVLLGGRGSSSAGAAVGSNDPLLRLDMRPDRLTALVCRNALADMSQDLPVSSSRGDRPASITGLWPLLTAFNHSCAPNAVAVLLGGLPQAEQQQQKLLAPQQQQQQQQSAASVKPAQLRRAAGSGSSSSRPAGAPRPVNRWAQPQSPKPKPPISATSSSSSNSSSNGNGSTTAPLTASGSGLLGVSGQPGVGPFVLVRTVSELAPGDEVTLDYLAAGVEGSLVHPERRRAALAQRWGFRCRCERCSAEAGLGPAVQASQQSAYALAAKLGPQVAAAIAAGDTAALNAAAASLRTAVQQLEQQVDTPTVQPRLAAWAHASIYQVHSLLAAVRMAVAPGALNSLASIGTAMELAGIASPGGPGHMLGAACLLVSSQEAWHDEDPRVQAAAGGLLQVLQLRYGPLDASVAERLIAAAQQWALQLSATRLGLVAPAAAAATRARLALLAADAAASKQQGVAADAAGAADTAAAAAAETAEQVETLGDEEGPDEIASALELLADEVLEVTEELLQDVYEDEDGGTRSSQGVLPDKVFVKKRSAEEVRQELELFSGYAAALQPEQLLKAQLLAQQQQQQQGPGTAVAAGSTAAAAERLLIDADEVEVDVREMPLAAWLQAGPADGLLAQEQQQLQVAQQQPVGPLPGASLQPGSSGSGSRPAGPGSQQHAADGQAGVRPAQGSSMQGGKVVDKPVSSLFSTGGKAFTKQPVKQQQQQQRRQTAREQGTGGGRRVHRRPQPGPQ